MTHEYLGHILLDDLAEKVAPATTALIVVDMQNDFVHPDGFCARALGRPAIDGFAAVVEPIRQLCAAARDAGVQVVFTRVLQRPDGSLASPVWLAGTLRYGMDPLHCMEGTWGQRVVDELEPQANDWSIDKPRRSAFRSTDLAERLRARAIRAVVCTGVAGVGCVESTLRDALELDFYAVVPRDAVGDNTPELGRATDEALSRLLEEDEVVTVARLSAVWAASDARGA